MRAGLQPIVQVLRRKGDQDFIEGSRLKCGCELPFGRTVAQRQRVEARFRACPRHPGGPGSDGTPRRAPARGDAHTRALARRNGGSSPPSGNGKRPVTVTPPPSPESFEEDLRRRQAAEAEGRRQDRARLAGQASAQEGEGLAAVVAAALQAALHPCGSRQHEEALAQLERGLRVAGRIR